MGLRDLSAMRTLKSTVEVGLVTGVTAKIGPTGWATSARPSSGSSRTTPTVARCWMSCQTWRVARTFFHTLSRSTPSRVSSQAMRASRTRAA